MKWTVLLMFVLLVGCAMTEQQIDELSRSIGAAAQTGAAIAAPEVGIPGGATAGLAGAVGTVVTIGIGLLLRQLRRKSP